VTLETTSRFKDGRREKKWGWTNIVESLLMNETTK